jgi:non-heme chloroperoxidase
VTEHHVRVGDLTVAVARPAEPSRRPPVLLIHGMFGGAWQWEAYQALLARHGYESHAINLRGHHDSRPVPDIGRVPVSAYVDDALEVARRLERPFVIGHSMGGLIAQKVAEAGACRGAVLLAAAPPRWIPVVSWVLLKKQLKFAPDILMHRPLFPDRTDADELMFNRTPRDQADLFYTRLVPESGRAGFDISIGAVDVKASRVTAPVLVITGTDDRFVVPRVARALARKYGAPCREYSSFGHLIVTEPGWEGPAAEVVEWMNATG